MPLGDVPGVRLISLQKDDGGPAAESGGWIETLDPALNSGPDAFLDTAAVMMGLDLIVACGSAAAHLAGALGRPVWIALPFVPHCRWMMDCGDSPWYPTGAPVPPARPRRMERRVRRNRRSARRPRAAAGPIIPPVCRRPVVRVTAVTYSARAGAYDGRHIGVPIRLSAHADIFDSVANTRYDRRRYHVICPV